MAWRKLTACGRWLRGIKQPFVFCGAPFWEGSMVFVGIHVKRIAGDFRETLESKAELYQQHGLHFRFWRKRSPRNCPLTAPNESRAARASPDDVC